MCLPQHNGTLYVLDAENVFHHVKVQDREVRVTCFPGNETKDCTMEDAAPPVLP